MDELLKRPEAADPFEVEKRRIWQGISERLEKEATERREGFSWRGGAAVAVACIPAGETSLAYSVGIGYNINEGVGFKTGDGLDGCVVAGYDAYE